MFLSVICMTLSRSASASLLAHGPSPMCTSVSDFEMPWKPYPQLWVIDVCSTVPQEKIFTFETVRNCQVNVQYQIQNLSNGREEETFCREIAKTLEWCPTTAPKTPKTRELNTGFPCTDTHSPLIPDSFPAHQPYFIVEGMFQLQGARDNSRTHFGQEGMLSLMVKTVILTVPILPVSHAGSRMWFSNFTHLALKLAKLQCDPWSTTSRPTL